MDDGSLYSRIIHETEDLQLRVTVSEFRGVEYLHIRKYFYDFDEEWLPSKEGVSMPLQLNNASQLFRAIADILALA